MNTQTNDVPAEAAPAGTEAAPDASFNIGEEGAGVDWAEMSRDTEALDLPGEDVAPDATGIPPAEPPPAVVPPVETPPTPETPPAAETPAPETPPAGTEPPPVTEPVTPETPPVEPPPETPPVETPPVEPPPVSEEMPAPTPESPVVDMETQRRQWQEDRVKYEAELEKYFAFSEEDAEKLREAPDEVLPKLAAKIYLDTYQTVMNGMYKVMPQVVAAVVQQRQAREELTQSFYGKWPDLNKPEYAKVIATVSATYANLKPQATQDEVLQEVGEMAMAALKLGVTPVVETPPPATPPVKPFSPATPGGGGTPPTQAPVKPSNVFTEISEEMTDDDSTF